ncbi:MAG TPA: SCO family protein [bacterium]|nr:SCO family protein [bacterium]
MRFVRPIALLLLSLGVLTLSTNLPAAPLKLDDYAVGNYPIGGDFTLTNQDGGHTSLKQFRGKAVLLTFGYTHCDDVCPATVALFKTVKHKLGPDGARMQAVFISVDPKRDTPAALKTWMAAFDPTFVGLTGSPQELKRTSDQYMSKFHVHEDSAGNSHDVDHLAFIYLIDPQGKVRYLFSPEVKRDLLVAGVKAVLAGKS